MIQQREKEREEKKLTLTHFTIDIEKQVSMWVVACVRVQFTDAGS